MSVRQSIGAALLLAALWVFWGGLDTALILVSRGQPAGSLIGDPAFLLPGLGSLLVAIGGLLAILERHLAGIAAWLGTALFGLLIIGIVASGGDSSLWMPRLLPLGIFLAGALALTFLSANKAIAKD